MTVGALIDRLYRQYLEPPDYQPAGAYLAGGISTIDVTMQFSQFAIPEDEELLRLGKIIEIGSELLRVTSYTSASKTATVERGVLGTTAAIHATATFVKIDPPYPRKDALESISNNIVTLFPKLFTVDVELLNSVGGGAYPIDDDLAAIIIQIEPYGNLPYSLANIHGHIKEYDQRVGGRAVVCNLSLGELWVRYKRRFGVATAETDTYEELGFDAAWENIVLAGAAADLMVGRDIPASHARWVGQALETEAVTVGQRQSIAFGLAQYRDVLLSRASSEMKPEYGPVVEMLDPFASFTPGGIQ